MKHFVAIFIAVAFLAQCTANKELIVEGDSSKSVTAQADSLFIDAGFYSGDKLRSMIFYKIDSVGTRLNICKILFYENGYPYTIEHYDTSHRSLTVQFDSHGSIVRNVSVSNEEVSLKKIIVGYNEKKGHSDLAYYNVLGEKTIFLYVFKDDELKEIREYNNRTPSIPAHGIEIQFSGKKITSLAYFQNAKEYGPAIIFKKGKLYRFSFKIPTKFPFYCKYKDIRNYLISISNT